MKERDQMISDLKMRSSEQREQVAHSSEETARDSQEQKTALEQHYKQIIAEISSRNEVRTGNMFNWALTYVLNHFLSFVSIFHYFTSVRDMKYCSEYVCLIIIAVVVIIILILMIIIYKVP